MFRMTQKSGQSHLWWKGQIVNDLKLAFIYIFSCYILRESIKPHPGKLGKTALKKLGWGIHWGMPSISSPVRSTDPSLPMWHTQRKPELTSHVYRAQSLGSSSLVLPQITLSLVIMPRHGAPLRGVIIGALARGRDRRWRVFGGGTWPLALDRFLASCSWHSFQYGSTSMIVYFPFCFQFF